MRIHRVLVIIVSIITLLCFAGSSYLSSSSEVSWKPIDALVSYRSAIFNASLEATLFGSATLFRVNGFRNRTPWIMIVVVAVSVTAFGVAVAWNVTTTKVADFGPVLIHTCCIYLFKAAFYTATGIAYAISLLESPVDWGYYLSAFGLAAVFVLKALETFHLQWHSYVVLTTGVFVFVVAAHIEVAAMRNWEAVAWLMRQIQVVNPPPPDVEQGQPLVPLNHGQQPQQEQPAQVVKPKMINRSTQTEPVLPAAANESSPFSELRRRHQVLEASEHPEKTTWKRSA
uniref:Transmembrane protein n=1 Tax=Panagrellus redivivus TaxID=6233 RepID=A0A7E4VM50_PANRE